METLSGFNSFEFSIDNGPFIDVLDTIFNLSPGIHTAILRDENGCVDADEIIINDIFVPFVEAGPDIDILLGGSEQINALTDANVQTISWSPPTGLSCADCLDPIASPNFSTDYIVTVLDVGGCEVTDTIRVIVRSSNEVFIPNTFSPNGDQVNDSFFPQTSSEFNGTIDMSIFDRWGNMIFDKVNIVPNSPEEGWDGFFNNKQLQPGVFVYRLVVNSPIDSQVLVGDITLVK